jgi:hypothetical protein
MRTRYARNGKWRIACELRGKLHWRRLAAGDVAAVLDHTAVGDIGRERRRDAQAEGPPCERRDRRLAAR